MKLRYFSLWNIRIRRKQLFWDSLQRCSCNYVWNCIIFFADMHYFCYTIASMNIPEILISVTSYLIHNPLVSESNLNFGKEVIKDVCVCVRACVRACVCVPTIRPMWVPTFVTCGYQQFVQWNISDLR